MNNPPNRDNIFDVSEKHVASIFGSKEGAAYSSQISVISTELHGVMYHYLNKKMMDIPAVRGVRLFLNLMD
jgi:hypothetical protein